MKRFFRMICLLFVFVFLLSSCGENAAKEGESTTVKTNETREPATDPSSENAIPLEEMILTRPQAADVTVVNAARALARAIGEKMESGTPLSVGTDLNRQEVPEILIGETNRAGTAEAKALLGNEALAFVIRRSGKQLAVVGTTDEMTCYGVEYLIREIVPEFVSANSIRLAEDYCYIETCGTLALVADGKTDFRVCASNVNMSTGLMQGVQAVRNAFKSVTGSSAAYFEDTGDRNASRDASTHEILIGSTYYPETYRAFSRLAYSEGVVAVEGNKIVLYGFTEAALTSAAEQFCNLVARYTDGKNIVLPEKLFLRVTDASVKVNAPVYPSAIQELVPVDGDGMMIYLPKTDRTEFESYVAALEGNGYTASASNQLGESRFYTYTKGRSVVNGGFDPIESVARVILEYPGAKLPISEQSAVSDAGVCEPLLTQVDLNNLDCQSGMSYIIRLRDGRFLVIDGGATDYDEAAQLFNLLLKQNEGRFDGKPIIAAWFLTHAHGDHWQAFLEMANTYASRVVIQSIVINLATPELFSVTFDATSKTTIYSKIKTISSAKVIYARTGQRYRIANATIDVWLTPEDLYNGTPNVQRGNDASVIYRLTCEGQTTMFLADAEQGIADVMVKRYGSALKSDMMQISHHGYSYSDRMPPLFRLVDPDVVLWPSVDHWYHYFLTYPNNVELVANADEIVPACHGVRELTLPYTARSMEEYHYANNETIYLQDFSSVRNIYDLGWQMSDSLTEPYTTPKLSLTYVNGKKGLLMTGDDCSTLSFLCRDHLKNVTTYTVTLDLNVESLGNGFSLWYHDPTPMNKGGGTRYDICETGSFTIRLLIDRENGTTRVLIDGSEVDSFTNTSNENGPLIFLLKNAKVFVSRVEVIAGIN